MYDHYQNEQKITSLPFQYQKRRFWEFYCPLCKRARRSLYWLKPRGYDYIRWGLYAVVLTVIVWRWLGLWGALVNLPLWLGLEALYRIRARQDWICLSCGFDATIYKNDVRLARKMCQDHLALSKI